MHGYQIIQEITGRSGGAWRPSPGSVYPTLQQLQDEGLISPQERDGKRVYDLTDEGRRVAQERSEEFASFWDGFAPADTEAETGDETAWGELVFGVAAAFVHVLRTGSAQEIAAARAVLSRTRADLYKILSEQHPSSAAGTSGGPADTDATPGGEEGDNGGSAGPDGDSGDGAW